jgi:predicted amidophosphoribosyltransferase
VGSCRFCADWSPTLAWVRSGFWLDHVARTAVHHLKYENCPILGELMAGSLVATVPRPTAGWLIPIPLGAGRMRTRGYNQTQVLARHLGERWDMPVATSVLRRARETKTQTALTPEARLANVAGAFVAAQAPAWIRASGLQKRQAILVDDVLTTGATLDAAASALAAAGWPVVGAVTFARAMPFETRLLVGVS